MGSLFTHATRRASLAHVRHVRTVPPGTATGVVDRVYRQVEEEFGMLAPPVALHAPAPSVLAATWVMLRETLLATGRVGRRAKEVVAAAVSLANECPYCVEVHGTTLVGLVPGPDATAIAADRIDAVADPGLRALARWARSSGLTTGGSTGGPASAAPFTAGQAPELIGTAVAFHYLNRMVNVFLRESPLPRVPAPALGTVRGVATRVMGRLARATPEPGRSLGLLPAAPLPADLAWAAGQPHVVAALARAGTAIDAVGARVVPEPVRRLVTSRLAAGTRTVPGVSGGAWLAEHTAGVARADLPAARLALLTAFASYQVTDALIEDLRTGGYDDEALIGLASWASLAAARQVGRELGGARVLSESLLSSAEPFPAPRRGPRPAPGTSFPEGSHSDE